MVFKWLTVIILLVNILDVYGQTRKVYKTTIKYLDGRKTSGRLILAKDSSLVIVTKLNDTLDILSTEIKELSIKRRFKHKRTLAITMGVTAIISGIIAYNTYQAPTSGYFALDRNASGILNGIAYGILLGPQCAGIIIGLKELSKKKYLINGSQLKYGYLKPYLKKYYK